MAHLLAIVTFAVKNYVRRLEPENELAPTSCRCSHRHELHTKAIGGSRPVLSIVSRPGN